MDGYATVDEAAATLRLDPRSVRKRLAKGQMQGERVGRDWLIAVAEVERQRALGPLKRGRKGTA